MFQQNIKSPTPTFKKKKKMSLIPSLNIAWYTHFKKKIQYEFPNIFKVVPIVNDFGEF